MKLSVLIFCIILLSFVFLSVSLLAIGMENILIKQNIDNPYINNRYPGWQHISIEDFSGFRIPSGWSVRSEDGVYVIIDASGSIWAYVAPFGSEEDRFSSYEAFIEEVFSLEITALSVDPFLPFIMMEGSDIDAVTVQTSSSKETLFCIQLMQNLERELIWLLMADISSEENQYNIAEAIVYSYAFTT